MTGLAETVTPLFDTHDIGALPPLREQVVRHGEVFTRRWVVDAILDLVGYTPDRELASLRLIEPACGQGAFVIAAAERLSTSCRAHGGQLLDAVDAIRAFDLLDDHIVASRRGVARALAADGWPTEQISVVVEQWIRQEDFLLQGSCRVKADVVVGNPPYVRLEDVPVDRAAIYRRMCPTMVGRADLYVGFYDRGLRCLREGGRLGFICADRWMRNQYGRALRSLIEESYAVEACITMHDVDAFEEKVSAYPAITVVARRSQGSALLADTNADFGPDGASSLCAWSRSNTSRSSEGAGFRAARLPGWFRGEASWPAGGPARLAMIKHLNERFRPLEDELTGTRVGIGVATGADGVFLTTDENAVEPDRLLPLALVRDLSKGRLDWSGHFLVNPWSECGGLVDLSAFPRLSAYLHGHEAMLRGRHVGRRQPHRWFRTIDRVDPRLRARGKLLFPDMKQVPDPVLDEGNYYPHHNLYYVVSDCWDLEVLGGLMMSAVAGAFVDAYAVKMRGGTLRFQAQYLRRVRVPDPGGMAEGDRVDLAEAFRARDRERATAAALRVYGLAEIAE